MSGGTAALAPELQGGAATRAFGLLGYHLRRRTGARPCTSRIPDPAPRLALSEAPAQPRSPHARWCRAPAACADARDPAAAGLDWLGCGHLHGRAGVVPPMPY
ncbi:hypothetical protein ACU4GD_43035 [Cupriavidus basilensis]